VVIKSQGQCATNGTSFGNNVTIPTYNVTGMVSVILNNNNTVTLNLGSTFATASGPDVRVFLVDRGALTNAQLRVTSNFLARPKIEMGIINGNGTASYTQQIPDGISISSYNTIYFYCEAFDQFWDFGSFMAFTSANCATLDSQYFAENSFKIYPNPARGSFFIQTTEFYEVKSFTIYSALGQKVFFANEPIILNAEINVAMLRTGVYYVEIIDKENTRYVKKLSIEN